MPSYLLQASYTTAALAVMIRHPQKDRLEYLRKIVGNLGGTIEGFWLSFGDYDIAAILNMPSNVSAAAFAVAVAAGGALKTVKTTPLLSIEEGLAAGQKAKESGYVSITAAP